MKDLAFFLATHGFDAEPKESYVVVKFAGGKEAYLTPNGAAPRLADLCMTPPTAKSGPVQVLSSEAVKINRSYEKTDNKDFIKTIERYQMFPVTPLGLCYDGSQKLHDIYESFGNSRRHAPRSERNAGQRPSRRRGPLQPRIASLLVLILIGLAMVLGLYPQLVLEPALATAHGLSGF